MTHAILRKPFAALAAALLLAGSAAAQPLFVERDGIVVGEAENAQLPSSWLFENSSQFGGFTGQGYIRFNGNNSFNSPAPNSTITYNIETTTPGTWLFRMRSRKDGAASDADNDTWVRMNNGNWRKHFVEGNNWRVWTFQTMLEGNNLEAPAPAMAEGEFEPVFWTTQQYNLPAGRHTLQFAGRSKNHRIDRWHLYRSNTPNALDASRPETVGNATPTPSPTPTPAPRQEFAYINFRNNQNNFTPIALRNTSPQNFAVNGAGLVIRGTSATPNQEMIAFWDGVIPGIVLQAGDVWEIEFEVTTEATAALLTQLPTMRLRVNDTSFQTGLLMNLESLGNGSNAPVAGEGRRYRLYYVASPAVAGQGLRVAFDFLYTPGLGDRADIGVILQEVKLTLVR